MLFLCGFVMSPAWPLTSSASSLVLPHQATANWATILCPPNSDSDSILPTLTYGGVGGRFSVCTQQDINAPAQAIYDTLLDFKSYFAWNKSAYQVDVPANAPSTPQMYVGMPILQHTTAIVLIINTTDDLIISMLDEDTSQGYLMPAWKSNTSYFGVLLPAEHNNVLTSLGLVGQGTCLNSMKMNWNLKT